LETVIRSVLLPIALHLNVQLVNMARPIVVLLHLPSLHLHLRGRELQNLMIYSQVQVSQWII
jgi:hypothetical protein